jgi:hypothetical protein
MDMSGREDDNRLKSKLQRFINRWSDIHFYIDNEKEKNRNERIE